LIEISQRMAQFSYRARRKDGQVVQGVIDVSDRAAALAQVERMGLFPVAVEIARGGAALVAREEGSASGGSSLLPVALKQLLNKQRKPKLQELATFMRQMANLLHAGMPLTAALNSMSGLDSRGIPKFVSVRLKQEVMEGRSLSGAMALQPIVFTGLCVNMVQAGEQSGALENVLRRLASHFERFAEVQSKFISALIYPAMVMAVGVIIIIVFMTVMLPKFLEIFSGMDAELPPATKFLMDISNLFTGYWWLLAAIVVSIVTVFKRYQSSERGRRVVDRWKMRAPIVGKVVRLNMFGQFCRTLGTLLQNGVPVLTALKITEDIMPNAVIKDALSVTRDAVTDGKSIGEPLARSRVFPQLMIDLLKIGEETGDVPGALNNLADTYESDLEIGLRVMTNLIEPLMIIVIAMFVGFLMYAVLSAMFGMINSIN
jgi:type IV pilus assembly protein PilC